jgi:UDP-N-acetylglucosamine transferase subunit ALG13
VNPLVVVLLGTDHHPFDRLVDWADEVALLRPDLHVLVQHGASRPPQHADGRAFLPHRELLDLIGQASAVACHGGPGTIMDARGAGHVPVCVPRDPALGEHVDGHQIRFAALAGRAGVVRTVGRADQFHAALHAAVATSPTGEARATLPPNPATDAARERLIVELERLVVVSPARRGPVAAAVDIPHPGD